MESSFSRYLAFFVVKFKSIFLRSISFFSHVEYSSISKRAKISKHCYVNHSYLGDYSYISPHTRLVYANIGKFCSIGGNCNIGMGTHPISYLSTSPLFYSSIKIFGDRWVEKTCYNEFEQVFIGDDVWIGEKAMVMGGVTIHNGAIIAAGAIVTKDVPPYAIVGGVPAKIIRYRFPNDIITQLEKINWTKLDDNIIRNNINLFQSTDFDINIVQQKLQLN